MFTMSLKTVVLAALSLSASVSALPIRREVPQEHSHEPILTAVRASLQLNNPDGISDPVFGLLGNAAAAGGAGKIKDTDCLQQAIADQAFTNAKKAKDVQGQVNALIFRALERNTGKVGQASAACTSIKAVNPEIAAIQQHQDPASAGAAATNKAITLELAKQIKAVGGNPQDALKAGTFAPGDLNDNTGKGNTCDDANNKDGCIFTENLLVPDATPEEIDAAVGGKGNAAEGSNQANGSNGAAGSNQEGNNNMGNNNEGKNNMGNNNAGSNNQDGNNMGNNNSGKNEEGKNNMGQNNEGKNNMGQNNEGKNNMGQNNNEGKNNMGQNNEGKNNMGKNNEGKNNEGKNNDGKNNDNSNNMGNNNNGNNEDGKNNSATATNCPAPVTVTVTVGAKATHHAKNKGMKHNTSAKSTAAAQSTQTASKSTQAASEPTQAASKPTEVTSKPTQAASESQAASKSTQEAAAKPTQAASNGANIQSFEGALGGASAPAVTAGGRGFQVDGQADSFLNQGAALGRSCDVQHNKCANIANSAEGKAAGLTVGQCDEQNNQCRALIGN